MTRRRRGVGAQAAAATVLAALATRLEIARRLDEGSADRLLGAIAEATVTLFDAEAASIALVDDDGRLRFRVAAGEHGLGVVGTTVGPGEGIAGFVLSTGQPIAVSNVVDDPRFARATAEQTGYVPRSLLAVPLESGDRVIGVLEVLDRRGREGFDLHDVSLAGAFARQAATAIEVTALERDTARLIARALEAVTDGQLPEGVSDAAAADAVARAAIDAVEPEAEGGFWEVVDRIARLRPAEPARRRFVVDVLDAAIRHLPGAEPDRVGHRPTWRERASLRDD